MMKKNNMIASLIFLSTICILLCTTPATNAIHFTSASNMSTADASMSSPTPDDPPTRCQNLTGRDTRDPLLNVPWNWRPDYARNDPCWTPQEDKNCSVADHAFNPDQGFESYTFTCLDCTFHMQSGPSGSSSYHYCNNK